jgi:glycosyltransferase involved in cell wall biosynthesis
LTVPSVVHVVITSNFAGVERYVGEVARATAARGWNVTVVGGDARRMALSVGARVSCLPGASPISAATSIARTGRHDICHAHMTLGEAVAVVTRPLHQAPVVSTRHFAAHRGATSAGRLLAPWIRSSLAREIAVSRFVAEGIERAPDAVLLHGVGPSPCLWSEASRIVLVLQRLESEKDTLTALRAWEASRLFDEGWSLRVVGDGSQSAELRAWVESQGVQGVAFADWTADVGGELARAGMLLAPAPAEPFGLAVLEAMAAGVPVVAAAGGGHRETIGLLPSAPMFAPGDAAAAAGALRSLLDEPRRARVSADGRGLVGAELTLERHIDGLLGQYDEARAAATSRRSRASEALR